MNNKRIYFFIIVLTLTTNLFSLNEINDYYDFGLNEKTGTYGLTNNLRKNSIATGGTFAVKNGFAEWFLRYRSYIDIPELYGVYFNFDMKMANSAQLVDLYLKMND
nr:hypothetical protein [Spirochaetota bacterium]